MASFRRLSVFALLAAISLSPAFALADPTQADIDEARAFLKEGREQLEAHQFARAVPLLEKAHRIMHVPPTAYDLMQAYAGVDKLVEARAIGDEIKQSPAKPNEPEAFAKARVKIDEAIHVLDGMIPTIVLHIKGPPIKWVNVTINDKPLTIEQLQAPYRVNQGNHRIVATADGYNQREVLLPIETREAKQYDVIIALRLVPVAPPAPTPKAPSLNVPLLVAGAGLAAVGIGTGIAAGVNYGPAEDAFHDVGCGNACRTEYQHRASTLQGLSWTAVFSGTLGSAAILYAVLSPVLGAKPTQQGKVTLLVTPSFQGAMFRVVW